MLKPRADISRRARPHPATFLHRQSSPVAYKHGTLNQSSLTLFCVRCGGMIRTSPKPAHDILNRVSLTSIKETKETIMLSPGVQKLVRRLLVLGVLVACLVTVSFQRKVAASYTCCPDCRAVYDACCAEYGTPSYCPFECANLYYSCTSGCSLECPMIPY